LLVNPYSKDEISDAIHRALAMPRDERIRRWRPMMDEVEQQDVVWWRKKFVDALQAVRCDGPGKAEAAEPVEAEG
jgi:trehalose 6-phosphate synthase